MTDRIPGKYDHLKRKVNSSSSISPSGGSNRILMGFIIALLLFGAVLYSGILNSGPSHDYDYNQESADIWEEQAPVQYDMIIYSSPDCSCCHVYQEYLEDSGFSTSIEYPQNLVDIKDYLGIPKDSRSCHTVKYGQYFVEGHVPLTAITTLADTQPDVDGISLPGMPAGSPGMGGEKQGSFQILAISSGEVTGTFMTI